MKPGDSVRLYDPPGERGGGRKPGAPARLRAARSVGAAPGAPVAAAAPAKQRRGLGAGSDAELARALGELAGQLPALSTCAVALLRQKRQDNPLLASAFDELVRRGRAALTPELSEAAAEALLVQHLLTAPLFRPLFTAVPELPRNPVAAAIERVIAALPPATLPPELFVAPLAPLYKEVAAAAASADFAGRQTLLNRVCEHLLRATCRKVADTHGIVYTPQPLVEFMCASVEWALSAYFGRSLAEPGVRILDPFTGTGNFLVNLMRRLPPAALARKYQAELCAHELLPLPGYLALLNIEHEFCAATGHYVPFTGLRLRDTFATAAPGAGGAQWSAAVPPGERAPIRVILGNPPYNAWQVDDNDNNRNRSYPGPGVAQRVRQIYGKGSRARNRSALADPYVKAFRWASDELGDAGIVCYVSNGAFIDGVAFDGMRRALAEEFDAIYLIDLGGNVRREPERSGAAYNVFGIRVGICITLLVRLPQAAPGPRRAAIRYHAVPATWRREEKCAWLRAVGALPAVATRCLIPDRHHSWLTSGLDAEFGRGLAIAGKGPAAPADEPIFSTISPGLKTNRDDYAYGFDRDRVAARMEATIGVYQEELRRWQERRDPAVRSREFLDPDRSRIAWSEALRRKLERGIATTFAPSHVRPALFRPFTRRFVYFDADWTERRYKLPLIFPDAAAEAENRAIVLSDVAMRAPFSVLLTDRLPDFHLCASADGFQCLPLYTYKAQPGGGWARTDNIRPSAVAAFQRHYGDAAITGEEIFYYVYALLHQPDYRRRFAANLKRELPRILLAPDFHRFAAAGRALAELHVNYQTVEPWPLRRIGAAGERVAEMRLRRDRGAVHCSDGLILEGVPAAAHAYRLGNRSALEWVVAQHRVTRDAHGRIRDEPHRDGDPEYLLRLIGQVITVSVRTQQIIAALPELS